LAVEHECHGTVVDQRDLHMNAERSNLHREVFRPQELDEAAIEVLGIFRFGGLAE
jgi:hypothetical protein